MPSPEQEFQPSLPKANHIEHGEPQTDARTNPQMERVVTQLAAAYGVDLSQKGANLSLDMPDRPDRWIIANLGGCISLTRCFVAEATKAAGQPVSDAHGDFDFVTFSNYIAAKLEQQGWLEQARQADEQVSWGYSDRTDANAGMAGSEGKI